MILSDKLISGGQQVSTFDAHAKPAQLRDVLSLLRDHFHLDELCAQRGQDPNYCAFKAGGGLVLIGRDGGRRVPIQTDEHLLTFYGDLRNTVLPSLEVKFSGDDAGSRPSSALDGTRRREKKREEELEDENSKMLSEWEKIKLAVESMSMQRLKDQEEVKQLLGQLQVQLKQAQQESVKKVQEQIWALQESNKSTQAESKSLEKNMAAIVQEEASIRDNFEQKLKDLDRKVGGSLNEVNGEIKKLKAMDDQLKHDDVKATSGIMALQKELQIMDSKKVSITEWSEAEEKMAERISEEVTKMLEKADNIENCLIPEFRAEFASSIEQSRSLSEGLESNISEVNLQFETIRHTIDKANHCCDSAMKEVNTCRSDFELFSDSVEERIQEVRDDMEKKDEALQNRINKHKEASTAYCTQFSDRLDSVVKVERQKFEQIDRQIVEATCRVHSELRLEADRLRVDYEGEAARLDQDLGDLHTKNDLVKQEMNFCQSRLSELREWAQAQLTEASSALKTVEADAGEASHAAERMLGAMRDDHVAFREEVSKHIGVLQHDCSSHGDAVGVVETKNIKIRSDLDIVMKDYRAFSEDVEGWAEDVRVKVERLYRAMEPARAEWRINKISEQLESMQRTMMIRSSSFNVAGLRNVKLEFYPFGTRDSEDGEAVLRVLVPRETRIRIQCRVGSIFRGPVECIPGEDSLWCDVVFTGWEGEIANDYKGDFLVVAFEILENYCEVDESLARIVKLRTE